MRACRRRQQGCGFGRRARRSVLLLHALQLQEVGIDKKLGLPTVQPRKLLLQRLGAAARAPEVRRRGLPWRCRRWCCCRLCRACWQKPGCAARQGGGAHKLGVGGWGGVGGCGWVGGWVGGWVWVVGGRGGGGGGGRTRA